MLPWGAGQPPDEQLGLLAHPCRPVLALRDHEATRGEVTMNDAEGLQQSNMELVARVGPLIRSGFAEVDTDLFADDLVFHFFNPRLPDLAGDHHGLDGIAALFRRLGEASDTGFHNEPHSLTPFGDELVVAYATNTMSFDGVAIDVDAVVVWRVFDGRIHEIWDIPAINTVRPRT